MPISTKEKEIAQTLLAWMKQWQVRNVYMWEDRHGIKVFGLSGKPLQLQRYLMEEDNPKSNYDHWLTSSAAGAFGIELEWREDRLERTGRSPSPQFWHGEEILRSDFLDGIELLLDYVLGSEEGARLTVMPEPGYPWGADYVIRYYDAKKNRVITSKKPSWAVMGTYRDAYDGRDKVGYVADYCKIFPSVNLSEQFPQTLMTLPRRSEVMVTHTLRLPRVPEGKDRKQIIQTAHEIKKCGGLIFPSLAVGLIPASNFGPITLVMSAGCVLTGLHPYRPKGRYPVVLYNADVWTETVGAIKNELGRFLFEELTGLTRDYVFYPDLAALGPILREGLVGSDDIEAKRIRNVREMETTIRKRFGLWKGFIRAEDWLSRTEMMNPTQSYAYLEAKVTNILGLENIKFAVCATEFKETTHVFLKSLGLRIPVYPVDAGLNNRAYVEESWKELREELSSYPEYQSLMDSWKFLDYLRYHFAWEASKVIRQVSLDSGSVLDI